jgi:hypothetical protein
MSFFKTYKEYFIVSAFVWAACFVLFVVAYLLVIGPQNRQRKNIENEFDKCTQMYEFAQKAAQEETKNKLHNEIELLRDRLTDFVVDLKGAEDLTFDISQIASENKVDSFSIEGKEVRATSGIADSNSISESFIEVSFTAGFNEFAGFLNSLERHRPVLFVNEFSLVRSNKDESAYNVTLNVAAFVRRQQVSKAVDKPLETIIDSKILK